MRSMEERYVSVDALRLVSDVRLKCISDADSLFVQVIFVAFLLFSGSVLRVEGVRAKNGTSKIAASKTTQNNAERQSKSDQPASSRQVAPLFKLPNHQLDSIFNPLELFWGWGLLFYYFLPGLAAIILGFIYPFYEYLRTGHTYYHPGLLFDKDFSEYTAWYFKHKIYKKKYWNLDAYLYHYFQSHVDNLKNFYHELDVPLNKLVTAGFKEKAEGLTGDDAKLNINGTGTGNATIEDVLSGLVDDMMEKNPDIKQYVEKDVEGKGYEKLKTTLKNVIVEQFASGKKSEDAEKETNQGAATETSNNLQTPLKPTTHSNSGEEPTAYAAYYGGFDKNDEHLDELLKKADLQSNAIPDSRTLFRSRMGEANGDSRVDGGNAVRRDPWLSAVNGQASDGSSASRATQQSVSRSQG